LSRLAIQPYIRILVVGSVFVMVWTGVAAGWPYPFMIAALQVIFAAWSLVALHCVYHLVRERGHVRRRRRDQAARDAVVIPDDVRPSVAFPEIDALDDAHRLAIGDIPDHQGRYRATGLKVALLPSLAVLFLSLQVIFFPAGGPAATGMAFAESLLLIVMVVVVWTNERPTYEWVQSRARAELFRREQYLLLAHVGPYLGLPEHRVVAVRDMRMGFLTHADLQTLGQLAVMAEQEVAPSFRGHRLWIDALWQAGRDQVCPDTSDRMRTYLHYRLRKQILWFHLAIGKCESAEQGITRLLKTAVLAAVAVALVYATLLSTGQPLNGTHQPAGIALVALLAAGLPPFCGGLLAIQDLFAFRRLAMSYRETRRELVRYEAALRSLITLYEEQPENSLEFQTRFRALVLHTESALTQELQRWVMFVYKPEFEPTA
jgi:hypothetical protein